VRPGLILTLASDLFKSYLRSSRRASVSFFSRPRVMLIIDVILFTASALAISYVIDVLTADLIAVLVPLVLQAMISLPVLMTLAIIVSGLMFELGQGSAISSSEAVNWLPVSPREYVAASAFSTSWLYSFFLALAAGITLPLTMKFGLFHLWSVTILLSVLSLFLGSFIVEVLKAIMNRVSSTVYKKRGRLAIAIRLLALILLFSIVQMAFQPYFLYWVLGEIVGGIEVAWIVPFIWPSSALVSLASYDLFKTALFALFSLLFTIAVYEAASQLRRRYWSPVPISISIDRSGEYLPQGSIGIRFGFTPLASVLAMKEFRALVRRKDLARFLAIPVVLAISFLVPTLASSGEWSGRGLGFFLTAFLPFIMPIMFSSISIGQEGKSIANLMSLPINPTDLIKGKLAPAWLISGLATLGVIAGMEVLAPMGLSDALATIMISAMTIVINSFIGLGIGARWPDYTIGARSRCVTFKGFIIGFIVSGFATLAVFAPLGLHIVTSGGILGPAPFLSLDLLPTLIISIVLGGVLIILSYIFCKKGVENLLSNI
jgi:hypothetical protein